MYQPIELARFALSEFERGLEGLTDEEARTRTAKADGTQMNAVSWTVGHIAGHWLSIAAYATGEERPAHLRQFASRSTDPTPPPLDDALMWLEDAKAASGWMADADDELLSSNRGLDRPGIETVGTALMRVILHTWFHTGEINAIRQMLGHGEIGFVGQMVGNLEWGGAQ